MKIKRQIGVGSLIILLVNILGIFTTIEAYFFLISLTSIFLCFLIYKLDISDSSSNLYYELGFTYTLVSIICSLILTSLIGLGNDGLNIILGNFGIALSTSAMGMILKVTYKRESLERQINAYNDALGDLTSKMRFIGDDIISTFQTFNKNLQTQSNKLDEVIERYDNRIAKQLAEVEESLVRFEDDTSSLVDGLGISINEKLDNIDGTVSNYSVDIREFAETSNEHLNKMSDALTAFEEFEETVSEKINEQSESIQEINSNQDRQLNIFKEQLQDSTESINNTNEVILTQISSNNSANESINKTLSEIESIAKELLINQSNDNSDDLENLSNQLDTIKELVDLNGERTNEQSENIIAKIDLIEERIKKNINGSTEASSTDPEQIKALQRDLSDIKRILSGGSNKKGFLGWFK